MKIFSLLVLTCFLLTSCHWFKKKDDPTPLEQLPPATQEGKRAFGCLLNGQVWIPNGKTISSNYSIDYDPTYDGGTFDLTAYRYPTKGNANDLQYLVIYMNHLSVPGTYSFSNKQQTRAGFTDHKTDCEYSSRANYAKGSLTITRLDPSTGIISGTFAFTMVKPGCDTVKVTNGRFDYKL